MSRKNFLNAADMGTSNSKFVRSVFEKLNKEAPSEEITLRFVRLACDLHLIHSANIDFPKLQRQRRQLFSARELATSTLKIVRLERQINFSSYPPDTSGKTEKSKIQRDLINKTLSEKKITQILINGVVKIENPSLINAIAATIERHVKITRQPEAAVTPREMLYHLLKPINEIKQLGVSSTLISAFLLEIGLNVSSGAINTALRRLKRQTPPIN